MVNSSMDVFIVKVIVCMMAIDLYVSNWNIGASATMNKLKLQFVLS